MVIKRDFDYYGSNRPLHIYLPEGYSHSDERYPVMYFFDGHNLFYDSDATYGKSWGLKTFLDGWEKDMIIVGMECSHVGNERLEEYLPYPATTTAFGPLAAKGNETLEWIVHTVKPVIDREYRTYPNRACTGIAGSSMGGLMAIRGVLGYNRYFSKAACVSSAIGFCPEAVMADVSGAQIDPDKLDDKAMDHIEAIIYSMTPAERAKPSIIDPKRKRRIAAGSGQTVEDVNKLLRQFEAMQKMMKKVKRNPKGFMRGLGGMRGLR